MAVLEDGPAESDTLVVLAHGAGAPMDSPLLTALARGLARGGRRVVRFEFPYMAARRSGGRRGPPDRTAVLLQAWRDVVSEQRRDGVRLFVGGHSMGGRMASMVADELVVDGACCVAYPWHPPRKPAETRTAHLRTLKTRALMVCGTRDEFGSPEEVAGYELSPTIAVAWLEGADHSLRARARSGRTTTDHVAAAVAAMLAFTAPRAA